jgi:hypothetical protein
VKEFKNNLIWKAAMLISHHCTSYQPCKITCVRIHYITNLIILIVSLKICWKLTFYLSYASTFHLHVAIVSDTYFFSHLVFYILTGLIIIFILIKM